MRWGRRRTDQRTRRMVALANLGLALGLSLNLFVHPEGAMARDWVHGVSGMLMGISLGVNFFRLRRSQRCARVEADKL